MASGFVAGTRETCFGYAEQGQINTMGHALKASSSAEMHEGPDAFDRFRRAMQTIVRVPKSAVVPARRKAPAAKKRSK